MSSFSWEDSFQRGSPSPYFENEALSSKMLSGEEEVFEVMQNPHSSEETTEVQNKILERFLAIQEKLCLDNYQQTDLGTPENRSDLLGSKFCPKIFDGWSCWNSTEAGTIAFSPCPFFVTGFVPSSLKEFAIAGVGNGITDCTSFYAFENLKNIDLIVICEFAHKECQEDGTWYKHPETNVSWSNYTSCVDLEDLEWRRTIITLYEAGYFISICALIISLIIFCSFKVLQCTRVTIHKSLFASFIASNVLWLLWYRLIIAQSHILIENPIWCRALHVAVEFFMVSNFFMMFCEGFFLHYMLVFSFFRSETALLRIFFVFAWICPIIPISIYVYFRSKDPSDNQQCWVQESTWRLFFTVPVCLSLVLSLIFLFNILRVLVKKLKDNSRTFGNAFRRNSRNNTNISENQHSLRKAVRAFLLLLPLLGLHYFLIPFRPKTGSKAESVYEVISAVSSSLQGFCVSLLFCFCNSEVINVFKKKICRRIFKPKSPIHRGEITSMSIVIPGNYVESHI